MDRLPYVRTLRRCAMSSFGLVHDLHVELHGNALRREAGVVAACLVSQLAVNRKVACAGVLGGAHLCFYGEIV